MFADYDAGLTFARLARKYSVSAEWVRQIVRRRERTGEVAARRPVPERAPFRATHEAALRQAVAEAPDRDPGRPPRPARGRCQPGHPAQRPGRAQADAKTKSPRPAESQVRPAVARARAEFRAFQRALADPDRFVFIDETWVKTNMTRAYGRGPTSERVVEYVPHGHWMTTTFVAALRTTGLTAPMVVDGAINGDVFVAYVEQVLAPTLSRGTWS